MKLLDIIKRAILEGKLDTELGIADGDVVKRFDRVLELLDRPVQLPKFELPTSKVTDITPPPYWWNNIWAQNNPPIVLNKGIQATLEGADNEKSTI